MGLKTKIKETLLPLAVKVIEDVVKKLPDSEEIGEKIIEVCLVILAKAVKTTKTNVDDQLFEQVAKALAAKNKKGEVPSADDVL
jgi:hypothetical protein|tara:strand:- start:243 stop:494 length:252 start_codon:yes stop_codon:yes gene_type:complete